MFSKTQWALAIASAMLAPPAFAAVNADEAKQLGGDKLTPFGSEKAGNKEGTIPPYPNKGVKAPASYDPKDPGQRPSPYANEKPLFSITAQNAAQYADKLDGMIEMFKRYPAFRLDVYPTHRDIVYPPYVNENSVKNATSCKAVDNELRLEGCYGGLPFPIPKTGNEVMWNHLLSFRMYSGTGIGVSTLTPENGKHILTARSTFTQQYPYYDPKNTQPNAADSTFWMVKVVTSAPSRDAGNVINVLDNLDMVGKGRRAYQYIPGQRRVKLAPNLAYDTPNPLTGGTSNTDDVQGFQGGLDRFTFKLIGKKEKFIPYNTFGVTNNKICSSEKLFDNKNFPHPDCIRWELHRVWQVEATLKPGLRHNYQKRVFFWDEDAPGAGVAENYDAANKLYRIVWQLSYPFYDHEMGVNGDAIAVMDVQTGTWITLSVSADAGEGWKLNPAPLDARFFSPEAMAGEGVR